MRMFLIMAATLGLAAAARADVEWEKDYEAARRKAIRYGKILFIDFRVDWSEPCKDLEKVTFQRDEVRKWFAGMVCVKIDATEGHPLLEEFKVGAFPTLVLIAPTGEVIFNRSGAPVGEGFVDYFAVDQYNAAVDAYNADDWKAAAAPIHFVRTYFRATGIGREVEPLYNHAKAHKEFLDAYNALEKVHQDKLARARKGLRDEAEGAREAAERRAKARELKAKADDLYGKHMKRKAWDLYRQVIQEYPDLPEAADARDRLRADKKEWKEPE